MPDFPFFLPVPNASSAASFLLTQKGSGRFVLTLNTELLARGLSDLDFARIIQIAPYRICDSVGAKLILKLFHPHADIPRIPGIDLGKEILKLCAQNQIPIFLLGGKDGVAERASEHLCRHYPNLSVVGTYHGYISENDLPALRGLIRRSGAKVVFVCLGSPMQEKWIIDNRPLLPDVELFLPLGGSMDVYAGDLPRAPLVWRKMGMEWLFRILSSKQKGNRICRLASACGTLFINSAKIGNILNNFSLNYVESDNRL